MNNTQTKRSPLAWEPLDAARAPYLLAERSRQSFIISALERWRLSLVICLALLAASPQMVCAGIGTGDVDKTVRTTVAAVAVSTPQDVIIELTAPPLASREPPGGATAGVGTAAESQRSRVRQAIIDLESQHPTVGPRASTAGQTGIRQEYRVVLNGFAARLRPDTITALRANPDVRRITPDVRVHTLLDLSVPHVRAPQLWSDFNYLGAGTTIAVIDTGVDHTHADLGGCFGAGCKVVGGYDFVNGDSDPMDDHGHGTHVASIAAGDGALAGVAPEASVLAYKVLDASGSGDASTIIAAIERSADPNDDGDLGDHVTVISMSLGGYGDEDDPMATAVDHATAAGIVCAIAGGNAGPGYFTLQSPGVARSALTVGATDDTDALAFFSSWGPTSIDRLLKPELTAPGVDICAARAANTMLNSTCRDSNHVLLSGTSMATPHVAGALALIRGLHPSLTPAEAKAILQQAAVSLPLDAAMVGAGRLDVRAAADVETVLTPAPVNLGMDKAVGATWTASADVTVRNLGSSPKTYVLSIADGGFPEGVTATISPKEITVDAGSAASVTIEVTVDNATVPDTVMPPYVHRAALVVAAGAERETVTVAFGKLLPPRNDDCAAATAIDAVPFGDSLDASRATTDSTDPPSSCGCGANSHSVWYRFTASSDATVIARTVGDGSAVVAAFTGTCGAVSETTCNVSYYSWYDPAQISIAARAGATYLIEVMSYCDYPAGTLQFSLDYDADGDGWPDGSDNCPAVANPDQVDCDADGIGDACDADTIDSDGDGFVDACDYCYGAGLYDNDGDGVCDAADACPYVYDPSQHDTDRDGLGDACDLCLGRGPSDADGDSVCDGEDNCPFENTSLGYACYAVWCTFNPVQSDCDDDGIGDACDPDTIDNDADGVDDRCDNCPVWNPLQTDCADDRIAEACTGDCNADGVVGIDDLISMVHDAFGSNSSCPAGDTDADGQITVDEIVAASRNALDGCRAAH